MINNKTIMDFKQFDLMVKTYYPLNKKKSRYLIMFNNGDFAFYKYGFDKLTKFYYFKREYLPIFNN